MRRVIIGEMITRLKCLAIVLQMNLVSENEIQLTGLSDNKGIFIQQLKERNHTSLEAALINWAMTTGDMRNHEATACHVDGNKSHLVETLTLFGRVSKNVNSSAHDITNEMANGKVVFPLDGLALEYRCGRDIIHCNFKDTMHVADSTRNTHNWSKVYGPK